MSGGPTEFDDSLDSLDEGSSMVPLIDVLFAVLASLMFALTAANFEGALDLDLPKVDGTESRPTDSLIVELGLGGQILLDGAPVPLDRLTSAIDVALSSSRRPVVLRADRTANFEDGARVLAAIRASSAGGASIKTDG